MLTEQEFTEAHKLYYVPLCGFSFSYLKDIEAAKDVVSNCFLNLWKVKEKYSFITVKSFLFISVKSRSLNEVRRLEVRRNNLPNLIYNKNEEMMDERMIKHGIRFEMLCLIYEAINKLPPRRKEVMLLWLRSDREKGAELAEILRIKEGTLKEHKQRAYEFIRAYCLPRLKNI